jgi:hypothetical protein
MRFTTAKEHRDFFQKHGWIEFEGLISDEQLILINQAIERSLADQLHVPLDRLNALSSEKLFLEGRDLWRSDQILRKIATQARFSEIASELVEKRPLRLGYDEFFPAFNMNQYAGGSKQLYSRFLDQTACLEDISCLKELACGLMLSLGGGQNISAEELPSNGIDVFPKESGRVIFFMPNVQVNWRQLNAHPEQRFYMIVYTEMFAYYRLEPKDPHTHALKRLGYIFNDKLSDKLHPIVYR